MNKNLVSICGPMLLIIVIMSILLLNNNSDLYGKANAFVSPVMSLPPPIPAVCVNNDYYCPWECNDYLKDNDCGIPQIYDFVESRTPDNYLASNMIHWDDTSWRTYQPLIQKVNELTLGVSDNFEKAKRIANWVKSSRPYGMPSPANEGKTVIEIFNSNTGVCMDAAILSTAMFRIAGIPSRAVLPAMHEYTEGYIGGRWIGFDATYGNGNATIINPVSSIMYNNYFYKKEPRFVIISSDGSLNEVTNVSYYLVKMIPTTIYKNTQANIQIVWNLTNQTDVMEKYCILSSPLTGDEQFNNFPILKTISGEDNNFFLTCKLLHYLDPYTEHFIVLNIRFTGVEIETETLMPSEYFDIDVETLNIQKTAVSWGIIYIPTSSVNIFKNNDNQFSLVYNNSKFVDNLNIRWGIKSDNLNCDYYRCNYVNSNHYSQYIGSTGILGYGLEGMPPNHYNGFSKISLPEGRYKLIYYIDGEVAYQYFEVAPNQKIVISPSSLIMNESSTENTFLVLKTALTKSIANLNPIRPTKPLNTD